MSKEIIDSISAAGGGIALLAVAIVLIKLIVYDVLLGRIKLLEKQVMDVSAESKGWEGKYYELFTEHMKLQNSHNNLTNKIEVMQREIDLLRAQAR